MVQVELDSLWYWALTHDIVESGARDKVFLNWSLRTSFITMMAAHFAQIFPLDKSARGPTVTVGTQSHRIIILTIDFDAEEK